jgi:hypothetical protein
MLSFAFVKSKLECAWNTIMVTDSDKSEHIVTCWGDRDAVRIANWFY